MLKIAGLFFITIGIGTYAVDLLFDHVLANTFARIRCGSYYLQTTFDGVTCGLDAYSSMLIICLTVALCGFALLVIPKLHPKH